MLTLATIALCVGVQTPAPAPGDAEPAQVVEAAAKALTDDEVKTVLAEFKTAQRKRKASLAERTAAVEALGAGSHDKLVTPLAKVVSSDPSLSVQRAAAQALGHQPQKKSRRVILKLLEDGKVKHKPTLVGDLISSLDTAGYESKDWRMLEKLFTVDYAPEHKDKQKAIITIAKNHEELEALDLLVENIDAPAPVNVDDPSNPPAEYWEARWKAWQSWREDVKDALFAITGQRFTTGEEARTWLRKNQSKLRKRR